MTAQPSRDAEMNGWLDQVVGQGWSAVPLAGDASFRRYLRVTSRDESWVVMDAPPGQEDIRPFAQVAGMLAGSAMMVPRLEAIDWDAGFLLLTDLGDDLYQNVLTSTTADALYQRAIEALISVQRTVDSTVLPEYDAPRLREETMLFVDWFLSRHLGVELSPDERQAFEEIAVVLEHSALGQPYRFVHRDYHSRNLLDCDGALGVIDFQDAVHGPLTYDLVSLLRDVYIEWPRADVERWVESYRQAALNADLISTAVTRETFLRWFDLMGVQRHLKVAGIFARLNYRDGKPVYLDSLPLTIRYLATVIPGYPELAALTRLFERLGDMLAGDGLVRGES